MSKYTDEELQHRARDMHDWQDFREANMCTELVEARARIKQLESELAWANRSLIVGEFGAALNRAETAEDNFNKMTDHFNKMADHFARMTDRLSAAQDLIDQLLRERATPTISIPTISPAYSNPSITWDTTWDAEMAKGWQFGSITGIHGNSIDHVNHYDPDKGPIPADVTTKGWYYWDKKHRHCYGPFDSQKDADRAYIENNASL